MKAVILAAGRGTRLGALTEDLPKPMVPVAGRPVLEHVIVQMRESGLKDFVVVTRYLAEKVEGYFGDGSGLGVNIGYVRQPEGHYGTGAGLLCTKEALGIDDLIMTFADVLTSSDTYRGVAEALNDADASTSLNWLEDPWRSAAVLTTDDGTAVKQIIEKPPKGSIISHWNNSGIFGFRPLIFDYLTALKPSARGEYELTDAFNAMIADGLTVQPYYVNGPWLDVGSPEDVAKAEDLVKGLRAGDE